MTGKIMVVDDNAATRRMVRNALMRNGHDVIEAADGETALELMRTEHPRVVLQDLGLPSYFMQNRELGAFYPFFAFYGATLFVITGLLALPLGSVNAVVVILNVAVQHGGVRTQTKLMRHAGGIEPLLAIEFVVADDAAHAVGKDLGAATGERIHPGEF